MHNVRWGILSTANIGLAKVVPAMQRGQHSVVAAIASRDLEKAQAAAAQLGIPKAYGSYEELLADPEIDAIYNPMPNHLHVPWSIRALQAGKHVLCEKPIALSSAQAQELAAVAAQYPKLKLMEAFMYRHHPQWQRAKAILLSGGIGSLRTIHTFFSYSNSDPTNVRNQADIGGGGLMDIGCYAVSLARWLFDSEPSRVCGLVDYDPEFGIDRLASAMLEFAGGTSTFTCATQLTSFQRVNIYGTTGRIEILIPFNAPPDRPTTIVYQQGDSVEEISFDTCDQYTLQGDLFSRAILDDSPVPTPIADAVANMGVVEAIVASASLGGWVAGPFGQG